MIDEVREKAIRFKATKFKIDCFMWGFYWAMVIHCILKLAETPVFLWVILLVINALVAIHSNPFRYSKLVIDTDTGKATFVRKDPQ